MSLNNETMHTYKGIIELFPILIIIRLVVLLGDTGVGKTNIVSQYYYF